MSKAPVITIDGPSGSGKGTIASWLANHLGWHFLDSGALYRLVALQAIQRQLSASDAAQLAVEADRLDAEFSVQSDGSLKILLNDEDVSLAVRTEDCSRVASEVAAIPGVRAALLDRQRKFCQTPGLVADGRDMGTVVFPDAELKIYLTASVEARAQRRYKQLNQKGIGANLATLLQDIEARDERDQRREASPLKPAADALTLDTTEMTISEVCEEVLQHAKKRGLA